MLEGVVMSITYKKGNIFHSRMKYLVCPVNTVGVMGAGLALAFKKKYPCVFSEYKTHCQNGWAIGQILFTEDNVICFPTKIHWRNLSKLKYIDAGLDAFVMLCDGSAAFPALGCGLGGLDFKTQVQPLMESYLENLSYEMEVYLPR